MSNNILLIAESTTLRFLVRRSFKASDRELIEAGSLAEGMQLLLDRHDIDGVIMTWLMLETDEFKKLLQLLKTGPWLLIPVVAITTQMNDSAVKWMRRREKTALTLLAQFEEVSSIMDNLLQENSDVTGVQPSTFLTEAPFNILFVDDSKSSRAYYSRLLKKNNYAVEQAESVDRAWSILSEHPPEYFDLVITDYFMPDQNGHVLCRRIRKNAEMQNLLTAVMTGTYFDDVIDISLRAGAIECMFKEESDQLFIARVASLERMARNQKTIQLERQRLSNILSSLGEGVYGVDANGYINFANPAALKILGYEREEDLTGLDAHDKLHYLDSNYEPLSREESHLLKVYQEAGVVRDWRTHFVNRQQHPISVSCTVVPLNVSGQNAGSVVAFRDITKQESMEKQLRWQATHDSLTNLHNRRYFEEQLEIERNHLMRTRGSSALLFLDLDRFKYINDTAGHEAGDKILIMVADSLLQRVRSSDVLARLGGDEFAVLLRDVDVDTLHETADKFRGVLSALHFTSGEHEFKVHGSIGVALIDPGQESSDNMANADIACHQAKAKGRNQTHIYDPESDVRVAMTSELGWANKLQYALDNDRFELCFQPILSLDDIDFDSLPESSSNLWVTHHRYRNSLPTYIESLIRLRDDDGNQVAPNLFLPSAERFGLMPKIDLWVIKNALKILQEAHDLGLFFTLGVNLSAITLEDQKAISRILGYIRDMPISSRHLAIEITERSAITNMLGVKSFVETINEMGCQFALDDFGAGFSSFAQLRHLPVKYVKIDGEYIHNMDSDDTDRVIVTSINDIAHSIGRRTIAEYVTSADILRSLKSCGVDYAQGFYIAKPMSKDELFVIYDDEPTVLAEPYDAEAVL